MARELSIDGTTISEGSGCYVIAEIGHNHQGKVETCKELFAKAKECGAHAVKLQKRHNKTLFTQEMYNSPYDNRNSYAPTYGEHREFLEFDRDQHLELQAFANEIGITFFSTAFDMRSADFLANLDMPAYKIASGDLLNIPLMKYVAEIGKPMIISSGYGTMEDVIRAYDAIMPINPNLCIMQCTSGYPAAFEELNLNVIKTYREQFSDIPIGLSTHDNGIAMAIVGYVLGAQIVEKHFTLNRAWQGTDQAFSLEPGGLRRMVRDLNRAHISLGDGKKARFASEAAPMKKMGKKIVAATDLPVGEVLTMENIDFRVTDEGLYPYEIDSILGKKLTNALNIDTPITMDGLQD
jgi:sialic acid synthase